MMPRRAESEIEIKDVSELTSEEKEEAKQCLRGGLGIAPGVEEKMRKAGLCIEEIEAMLMRALGGEN